MSTEAVAAHHPAVTLAQAKRDVRSAIESAATAAEVADRMYGDLAGAGYVNIRRDVETLEILKLRLAECRVLSARLQQP